MLVLTRSEIEKLIDPDELIEAVAKAMAELSRGVVSMAPRTMVRSDKSGGMLGSMVSYVPGLDVMAAKLVSVFPSNASSSLPTHQAVIVVFDARNGSPVALLEGAYITEVRTAAASAVATRFLSREDSRTLAILGTGAQAKAHARAMLRVRAITSVRIAGRSGEKVRSLADQLGAELGIEVIASSSFGEAMTGADVVCATTHSPEPVVRREFVQQGMHINSVGVNPDGREVDPATVRDALVVVDSVGAAIASPDAAGANDLTWAIRDGFATTDQLSTEIGEIVAGTKAGRTSPDQITLYKSVGVAVQDAAAASLVLEKCRTRSIGVEVEL